MQDNFDKKLAERIVRVFDEFEDDSVDQGWEQLRSKYPAPRQRSAIVYWLGSAAAVLLLIAGVWLLYPESEQVQLASQQKAKISVIPQNGGAPEASVEKRSTPYQAPESTKDRGDDKKTPISITLVKRTAHSLRENLPVDEKPSLLISEVTAAADSAGVPTEKVEIASAEPRKQTANENPLASGGIRRSQTSTTSDSYDELQQAKRELLADGPSERKEKRKDSRVSFSLYAGSYVSYAQGSKSRVNTGVGVSSEVDLTSKLKITTGVSIAQNSLRYDSRIPQQAAASFLSSAMSDSKNLMVASPDAKISAINYSINGYDASLLGLDVPVNLKYTFFEKKDELYVVAGLSSNYFFDEKYTYDYGYNSIYDSSVESFPDEKTTTNTSSFDFARMLNLSVGYGYPIGKQSKLSLEPFLKYPLGGLGSQDIRFSSAGLNLKWNFSSR